MGESARREYEPGQHWWCAAYHLAHELTSGLDTSPSRHVLALKDFCSRSGHLVDEAFVGYNTAIEIDLCGLH